MDNLFDKTGKVYFEVQSWRVDFFVSFFYLDQFFYGKNLKRLVI